MKSSNKTKKFLKENVWGRKSSGYYDLQIISQELFEHPGYSILLELAREATRTLDIGCGDGRKTSLISTKARTKEPYGVDISPYAIKEARKKDSTVSYTVADIEFLPFDTAYFDLVYSGFVLEHTQNTEKIILEAIRVLKPGGFGILLCPNYGSPNRSSPCYNKSRIKKLFYGFLLDFYRQKDKLSWEKVTPMSDARNKHTMDFDTTVEPYLLTLKNFLESNSCEIFNCSSLWELEDSAKLRHKFFKLLGEVNIYPFIYWGPQVLVVFRKK